MADRRTWDNDTFAAYMRGRRGDSPPKPKPLAFGSIVASKLQGATWIVLHAIHAALTEIGIDDAAAMGFSLMPGGYYRCSTELKLMIEGRQVVIPAGSDVVRS